MKIGDVYEISKDGMLYIVMKSSPKKVYNYRALCEGDDEYENNLPLLVSNGWAFKLIFSERISSMPSWMVDLREMMS